MLLSLLGHSRYGHIVIERINERIKRDVKDPDHMPACFSLPLCQASGELHKFFEPMCKERHEDNFDGLLGVPGTWQSRRGSLIKPVHDWPCP